MHGQTTAPVLCSSSLLILYCAPLCCATTTHQGPPTTASHSLANPLLAVVPAASARPDPALPPRRLRKFASKCARQIGKVHIAAHKRLVAGASLLHRGSAHVMAVFALLAAMNIARPVPASPPTLLSCLLSMHDSQPQHSPRLTAAASGFGVTDTDGGKPQVPVRLPAMQSLSMVPCRLFQ